MQHIHSPMQHIVFCCLTFTSLLYRPTLCTKMAPSHEWTTCSSAKSLENEALMTLIKRSMYGSQWITMGDAIRTEDQASMEDYFGKRHVSQFWISPRMLSTVGKVSPKMHGIFCSCFGFQCFSVPFNQNSDSRKSRTLLIPNGGHEWEKDKFWFPCGHTRDFGYCTLNTEQYLYRMLFAPTGYQGREKA